MQITIFFFFFLNFLLCLFWFCGGVMYVLHKKCVWCFVSPSPPFLLKWPMSVPTLILLLSLTVPSVEDPSNSRWGTLSLQPKLCILQFLSGIFLKVDPPEGLPWTFFSSLISCLSNDLILLVRYLAQSLTFKTGHTIGNITLKAFKSPAWKYFFSYAFRFKYFFQFYRSNREHYANLNRL